MFEVNELLKATKGRLVSAKVNAIIKGISIDSRTIRPDEAFIAIKGLNFDGHNFIDEAIKKGSSCIIKEPQFDSCIIRTTENACLPDRSAWRTGRQGRRKTVFIEVKDTTKALGDIAGFTREKFDIPVIAVTGSNGKTTAKEMIAWVLSQRFKVLKNIGTKNNQIGLPLTLLNLNRSYDTAVVEIGTNHPGEVAYLTRIAQPNIGIITNVGPAHLEYLKNLAGVFREKYTLIKHLKNPRIVMLNIDDNLLKRQAVKKNPFEIILSFAIKNKADFFASKIKSFNARLGFLVNQKYRFTLNTLGYYNIYNALVAITVARLFGMGYRDIVRRLATFNFPQSRLNIIELNKIRFIDDTYNSNPVSLKQALDTLDNLRTRGKKIFVMGDMLELGSRKRLFHCQAGQKVAKICDAFITVGELSKIAAEAAKRAGFNLKNIFTCETSQEARDILFNKISPKNGDIILVKGSRAMKMEEVFKI